MHSRSGVYMILDTVSGRRYIGSAVNIPKRWKEHRRGLESGDRQKPIALDYGVDSSVISEIKNRRSYRWVD